MVKVLNPMNSADARGQWSGAVFSKNRTSQYARGNVSPVQPRSVSQTERRYSFQYLNRLFLNLSSAALTAWSDFADNWTVTNVFGNQSKISAINWFAKFSSRQLTAHGVYVSTPPLSPNADYFAGFSISQSGSGDIIMHMSTVPTSTQSVWVRWSGAVPLSRNFRAKSMKQRTILLSGATSPTTLLSTGELSNSTRRQFEVFGVDTSGRSSTPQRFNVDVSGI